MTRPRCDIVRWTAAVSLLVAVVGTPVWSSAEGPDEDSTSGNLDVAQVVSELRPENVLEVSFREKLSLPYLTEPLISYGKLTVRSDGLLIRRVEKPNPSTVVMNGSDLVIEDASGTSRMDLSESPEAAAAVSLLRLLVTGDAATLEKRYAIESVETEDDARWSIRLTPRDDELEQIFTECTLVATSDEIEQITLHESDDAVRVISFTSHGARESLSDGDREILEALGVDEAGR